MHVFAASCLLAATRKMTWSIMWGIGLDKNVLFSINALWRFHFELRHFNF